ncbi:helix-turn-helix domain-containing protein [Selenomonas ruminantium]|uniref:helix-turn-helix domain-containing protein n=1 Tax=Selenomonas ruminantium TaxID=971 RepID=UPI0026EF81CB|nr:helix-turn-helix transcriptional regulator [Selenomonas ruminantium]
MSFQDNLRQYREKAGINAKDFAAQLGIKYTTYTAYENQGREPKYDVLCKIAAALHVSIDELMDYKPDRLQYWLDKFPIGGLHARPEVDKVVICLAVGEDGEIWDYFPTCPPLSKDEFINEMEKIDAATKKEMESNYELIFSFFVSRHFLKGNPFTNNNPPQN